MQRTIEFDEAQLRALERLAAEEQRTVDDLVRQAVDGYLAQRRGDWSDWGKRFEELVARVQAHMPPGVTPEEIEAEITAARAEYRGERAAARRVGRAPNAGSS